MSALRIRYEIAQVKSRYDSHKLLPENALHLAGFAAESYYQWAARYPKDSWLGSTGLNLAHLYEDLPGNAARSSAIQALTFVRTHVVNTRFSRTADAELRRGMAVKPDPAWAKKMRATPTPVPAPSVSGSSGPDGAATPSPKPTYSP